MMNNVIEFENFYFGYNKDKIVLDGINFAIKKGSFTTIIGASGVGKTTLCKAIAGIVPYYMGGYYHGDVKVLGESTKGKKVSDLALKVGLVLEDYESQLVSLTAGEEVAFGLLSHGFSASEVEARTKIALEEVGLAGRESYQLDELSGGQRQRLLLATILAVKPEVIVLDEPVSAMDPEGAEELYSLLAKIHKDLGTTIVVVEQRVEFVLPYMTDIIAIKEGEVLTEGACADALEAIYEDAAMRPLLPELWQVKCQVEAQTTTKFGLWRNVSEAITELKNKGFGNEANL